MQGGPSGFVSGDPFDVDYDGETDIDEESKGFSDTGDERGDDPYSEMSEMDWADVGEMMGVDTTPVQQPRRPMLNPRDNEIPAYDAHQKASQKEWKDTIWAKSDWHADWVLRNYGIDREGNLLPTAKTAAKLIRKTILEPREAWICPHCNEEIHEKHDGINKDGAMFHRAETCGPDKPIERYDDPVKEAEHRAFWVNYRKSYAKTAAVVTDKDSEPMEEYKFQGLPIVVENKAGTYRTWKDQSGKSGKTKMIYDYGYIDGYHGVDGDEVDVYKGPNDKSTKVFVIHQMKTPEFKTFDEDKVMLGFDSEEEAKEAYLKHYDKPGFYGGCTPMSMEEFKKVLKKNATEDDPSILTHLVGEAMKTANRPDNDLGDGTNNRRKSPETVSLVGNGADFTLSKGELPSGYQGDAKSVRVAMMEAGLIEKDAAAPWEDPTADFGDDDDMELADDAGMFWDELGGGTDAGTVKKLIKMLKKEHGISTDRAIEVIEDEMDHDGEFDDVRSLLGMKPKEEATEPADPTEMVEQQQPLTSADGSNPMGGSGGTMAKRKTATVGRETESFDKGDKVIYKPTGRTGKITVMKAHVATVQFDDDKNPQVRNCLVDDLTKATAKNASTSGLSMLKQLAEQAMSGESDTEEDMQEKEAFYLSEDLFGYTLHALIHEADGKTRNYDNDLPEAVVRQVLRTLDDKREKRDLSLEEESDYGLLTNEEESRHEGKDKKEASFEDETLTAPISDEEANELLGWDDVEKTAARFDREMGLAHHEYYGTPPMHIMAEKIEAEELGMDIFGEENSYDFTPGERSISSIAVQNLVEERPRLLADRSALIMAAAKAYRKVMKPIRSKVSVDQVNLSKISAHQVDENLGTMMTGVLEFQVTLASHTHRRRANVTLEMPVVAGEPVEAVTMITAGGERLPFTLEAVDKVMNVRRDSKAVGRGYHGVPLAFHFEY